MPKRKKFSRKSSPAEKDNPVAKRRAIEAKFRRLQEKRARKTRLAAKKKDKLEEIRKERESQMRLLREKEASQRKDNLQKRRAKKEKIDKRKDEERKREEASRKASSRGEYLPLEEAPMPKPLVPADPNILSPPKPIKPEKRDSGKKVIEVIDDLQGKDQDVAPATDPVQEVSVPSNTEEVLEHPGQTELGHTGVRRIKSGGSRKRKRKPSQKRKKVRREQKKSKRGIKESLGSLQKDLQNIYNDYQEKKNTKEVEQNRAALRRARERLDPSFVKNKKEEKKKIPLPFGIKLGGENPLRKSIRRLQEKRLEQNLQDVVGLDLGASSIRAVSLDASGDLVLAERAIPEGIIVAGVLQEEEELAEEIKHLWNEAGIDSKKVNFSLSNESLTVRTVFLPSGDKDDIESALSLNADAIIAPMDPDDSVIDYKNLLRSGPEVAVQVLAADKAVTKSYAEAVRDAGLIPVAAQIGSLVASKTLVVPRSPKTSHALIDIGAETTKVLACSGPDVFYLKVIPIAGNHFTRAIMNEFDVSWLEAEELKAGASLDDKQDENKRLLSAIRPVADRLAQEILQGKESYSVSEIGEKRPLESCLFIGGGSMLPGLREQIQFFAGFHDILETRPSTAMRDAESVTYFSAGLGLTIDREGSLLPEDRRGVLQPRILPKISSAQDKKKSVLRENKRVSPLILALLFSVLALTAGIFWSNSIKTGNEEKRATIELRQRVVPQKQGIWSGLLAFSESGKGKILALEEKDGQQRLLFAWRGSLDDFRSLLTDNRISIQEISILRQTPEKRISVVTSP